LPVLKPKSKIQESKIKSTSYTVNDWKTQTADTCKVLPQNFHFYWDKKKQSRINFIALCNNSVVSKEKEKSLFVGT